MQSYQFGEFVRQSGATPDDDGPQGFGILLTGPDPVSRLIHSSSIDQCARHNDCQCLWPLLDKFLILI
jgi:hypothetical protein